jgi:putative oxidoreductase
MAVFSLATAFFFTANFGDQNQMIHFLKNVVIAGGSSKLLTSGPARGVWTHALQIAPRKAILCAN